MDKLSFQAIQEYAEAQTSSEDALLAELNRETHVKMLRPQMLSGAAQGRFLELFSRLMQPASILEIGAYTGYSAICLARGLKPGGRLDTIDRNDELQSFAEKYFQRAGLIDRIHWHTGEALEVLPNLKGPYDLIFFDADKREYRQYYELCLEKLTPNGVILVDNALWYGQVLNSADDPETKAIQAFNEYVTRDSRTENVLLPLRDGLMMIKKKTPGVH